MYQNGRRVEGYLKDRHHKRVVKNKCANLWGYNDYNSFAMSDSFDKAKYWQCDGATKGKGIAKDISNARLRTQLRELANAILDALDEEDYEDFDPTPRSPSYNRKVHDSWWDVW